MTRPVVLLVLAAAVGSAVSAEASAQGTTPEARVALSTTGAYPFTTVEQIEADYVAGTRSNPLADSHKPFDHFISNKALVQCGSPGAVIGAQVQAAPGSRELSISVTRVNQYLAGWAAIDKVTKVGEPPIATVGYTIPCAALVDVRVRLRVGAVKGKLIRFYGGSELPEFRPDVSFTMVYGATPQNTVVEQVDRRTLPLPKGVKRGAKVFPVIEITTHYRAGMRPVSDRKYAASKWERILKPYKAQQAVDHTVKLAGSGSGSVYYDYVHHLKR